MKYVHYTWYVIRHKWWVIVYGLRIGAPLLPLLLHDNSKFLPSEFFPYVEFFNGGHTKEEIFGPVHERFLNAVMLHKSRNKHHPEYWLSRRYFFWLHRASDEQAEVYDLSRGPTPMPYRYCAEMIADWMGAGKAINGRQNARGWYEMNGDKLPLHPTTRREVEAYLACIDPEPERTNG
jgi:hypothetical protein